MSEAAISFSDSMFGHSNTLPMDSIQNKVLQSQDFSAYMPDEKRYNFSIQFGGEKVILTGNVATLPDPILSFLTRLAYIVALPENWDSYGAPSIARPSIGSALGLYLESRNHTGCEPTISPSQAGGVELFWESGSKSLEVVALGTERFDTFFEDEETNEVWDPGQPVRVNEVWEYLDRLEE